MPLDTMQQKWLIPQACVQELATSHHPGVPFSYLQPQFEALLRDYDQQVSCLNGRSSLDHVATAPEKSLKCSQKRFLIFDQSGDQTRLLRCGFPSSTAAEAEKTLGLCKELGEDHGNGHEESEMHEDTEEINALLYSDDDGDWECDDNDDDDDEVMSTGQSPFTVEQQACRSNNKTTQGLDETDDDGPLRKRQKKLLDHPNRDSSSPSFVVTKDLPDSRLFESTKQEETGSGLSEERSRKHKIHIALRILESVVPGAKGKEALLLIDEAIDYLKSLKQNLKGLNK